MGDLSANFSRHEFACQCSADCGYDTVDAELVQVLEELRQDYEGAAITINSGHRCPAHNAAVGGAEKSVHLTGKACDIVVDGILPARVYAHLIGEYPERFGIGSYDEFTHIDVRSQKARW
jgi:uncharacterized protein YcbK (DUF882 family)